MTFVDARIDHKKVCVEEFGRHYIDSNPASCVKSGEAQVPKIASLQGSVKHSPCPLVNAEFSSYLESLGVVDLLPALL